MMRKRNNNNNGGSGGQRRHSSGGHSGGGQRRYNNNSGGGNGNRSGGGDHQNLARQKHHATQMREKYMNHARDAQISGDRPDVEYYLQHVDHYNRVLTDIAVIENERQAQFREQQQQHQPQGQEGSEQASGNDGQQEQHAPQQHQQNDGEQNNGSSNDEQQPVTPGNQPRMTRGPRRQHNNPRNDAPRGDDHNGAQAANANSEEIPLPGGALTAI